MKEPTREQWAEDYLSEAHDALNRAAVKGELCHKANEARFLMGQALTRAARPQSKGMLGEWPEEETERVREAQKLLHEARRTPDANRAKYLCDDALRLIEAGGKLRMEFKIWAADLEAPVRFFGNSKVVNEGRGHGVRLNEPHKSVELGAKAVVAASRGDEAGSEVSWKQRVEKHARGKRVRRSRGKMV